ncbi:uncharacterized protein LOC114282333 [Camellia sinensis]|uniref:uncharacterized protein LOC114282333 n=1 Tax=Camellia sinensis TaxID=4442 RepID=UPI0010365B7F|nr:uncharacterized protein LOC114282333 [Camellia sinensis]
MVKCNKKKEIKIGQKRKMKHFVKAWLHVSEDAATGTDQSRARLWNRIRDEFNQLLGYQSDQISSGSMHRRSSIQSHINKYSGFVHTIERTSISGYNLEDSVGDAKQLYYSSQDHYFKWHDSSNPSTLATTPSSATGSISLDNDDDSLFTEKAHELPRPVGRKTTKNMHRKNTDQLEAINLFVAEFNILRNEQKEIVRQEVIMENERERLKLQAKQEREQRRAEVKLEQERMRIAAKREQERMRFEKEIMMTDPNLIPTEEGKAWVIAQYKEIWAHTKQ